MNTKAIVIGAVLIGVALVSPIRQTTAAPECAGNACGSVSVTWTGSCYNIRNNGPRAARVSLKPFGGIASLVSRAVAPGDVWTPMMPFTTSCLGGYEAPYQANFE